MFPQFCEASTRGSFTTTCSWSSSAKLLGSTPLRARWIKNEASVDAHGLGASLTLSKKSATVKVVGTSRSQVRTEWTNYDAWISDSSGAVKPGWLTTYVSVRSTATASHPTFGTPHGVSAYAGAL